MLLIESTEALTEFCDRLSTVEFITVDTEFMREKTYWPQLCLIQVAGPGEAAAIDPLAPGMDLAPLFALLDNPLVLKVFHAARQDVEIFHHLSGRIPAPLFDTQVAAMVCGFGDSVGYETLASKLARAQIDKSLRFTDWAQRPLTERQLHYALSDVTHLRIVYEKLRRKLQRSGRASWLEEEMAILTSPATYDVDPRQAWRRLKSRSTNPRLLAILREVAAWRELESQRRDLPRNRILRDEALLEIAAQAPKNVADLARTRGMSRSMAEGTMGQALLEAVARGLECPPSECPKPEERVDLPRGIGPIVDLLKVLLKMKCEQHDVAQKLVASSADLDLIAADDHADVPALHGWRRKLFGEDALALKHGRLALTVTGKRIEIVEIEEAEPSR